MIYGLNVSEFNELTNQAAFLKGSVVTKFFIHRATQGMRDDQQWSLYHKLAVENFNIRGDFWWLNHDWAHGVAEPWVQAGNYWQRRVSAGLHDYNIPPVIDIEGTSSLPLPAPADYLNHLKDAVDVLSDHAGRLPILYTNLSTFNDFLNIDLPGHEWVNACPIWLASPRSVPVVPTGDDVDWELWQFALDVKDWPGIATLDGLNRWPGSYDQMLAWCNDPSMETPDYDPILDEGDAPDPEPEPEPVIVYFATIRPNITTLKLRTDPSTTAPIIDKSFATTGAAESIRFELDGAPVVDNATGITWASLGKVWFAVRQGASVYADITHTIL